MGHPHSGIALPSASVCMYDYLGFARRAVCRVELRYPVSIQLGVGLRYAGEACQAGECKIGVLHVELYLVRVSDRALKQFDD